MRMHQRWNPITVTTVCQSGIVMKHISVSYSSITHQGRQTTAFNSYDSICAVGLFAGVSGIGISVARLTITWSLKDNRTLNRVISGKGCGPGDFAATHTLMLWFSSSVPELFGSHPELYFSSPHTKPSPQELTEVTHVSSH